MWSHWSKRFEDKYGDYTLSPRPFVEPIARLARRRLGPKWTAQQANAAKHAAVTGAWAQEDWYIAGKADSLLCQSCGVAVGSKHHRYHECGARHLIRVTEAPREWQHVARTSPTSLLWTRGLVRHPAADWKFQPVEEHITWRTADGEEPCFTGVTCSDGSKLGSSEFGQSGWAAVSVREDGVVDDAAWGALPVSLPVHRKIKRAELFGE